MRVMCVKMVSDVYFKLSTAISAAAPPKFRATPSSPLQSSWRQERVHGNQVSQTPEMTKTHSCLSHRAIMHFHPQTL